MRGRTTTGAAMLVAALTLASCGEDEERGDPAAEAGADGGGEGAEGGEPQCPEGTRWADGECHPSQGPGGDEGGEAGGGEGAGGQGGEGAEAGGAQGDDGGDGTCETDAEFFEARLWAPVFEGRCLACHVAGGAAAATRMVLEPADADGWLERNLAAVQAVAMVEAEGRPLLLQKPTGRLPHGGGVQIAVDAAEYPDLEALVARLRDEVDPCGRPLDGGGDPPPPDGGQDCDALRPGRRLLRRLSHTEYDNTVRDLTGVQVDAHATFVADPLIHGFENHPEALEVSGLLAVQQNQVAESVGERIDLTDHLPCALAEGDMACAHAFIARFGGRAFRRPLTAAEIAAYRELFALVMAQECFEQGARWVVTAMLQSPHFLYRAELGRSDGEDFALTPHEIASEMSYLLWQSMPDEPLRARADDGGLLDPAVRAEQRARMLDDPRTLSTLHDFVGRWLGADAVLSVVRDSEIYEALYFELRESLLLETRLFASDLWVRGRPWGDLFTADHTFLDGPLAEYYGLDLVGDPGPEGFHKVPLGGARAGGVLAHGSVMTAHAAPTSSSPIHRGILIREQALCEPLPPPPAGLDIQPPAFDPDRTTRQRFSEHTDNEACAGCHRLIDGIGFGFERYDGIGRYRQLDGGAPVDASGVVVRAEDPDVPFEGVGELAEFLAGDAQVARCYTRQWLRFGVGETEGLDADCHVRALADELADAGGRMSAVLEALTRTPHFTRRAGEVGEGDAPGAELTPDAPGAALAGDDPATPPAGLQTPACGAPPPGPDGPGPGAEGLDISVREDRWQAGLCAYYTVRNVSADPVEWAFEAQVEGTINNAWNVSRSGDSGRVRFSGVEWNRVVAPEQQVEFGYCADL